MRKEIRYPYAGVKKQSWIRGGLSEEEGIKAREERKEKRRKEQEKIKKQEDALTAVEIYLAGTPSDVGGFYSGSEMGSHHEEIDEGSPRKHFNESRREDKNALKAVFWLRSEGLSDFEIGEKLYGDKGLVQSELDRKVAKVARRLSELTQQGK